MYGRGAFCVQGPQGRNGMPGKNGIPGSNGKDGMPGRDGEQSVILVLAVVAVSCFGCCCYFCPVVFFFLRNRLVYRKRVSRFEFASNNIGM